MVQEILTALSVLFLAGFNPGALGSSGSPPVTQPAVYFNFASKIPLKLYSNYLCAKFNVGTSGATPEVTSPSDLTPLMAWFQEVTPTPPPPSQVFQALRVLLLSRLTDVQASGLRSVLYMNLNADDLQTLVSVVFDTKYGLALGAYDVAKVFYGSRPGSTADHLADRDRRRLLSDLVLAANGRSRCRGCGVNFNMADQIVRVVYSNLVAKDCNSDTQSNDAVAAMIFLGERSLTVQDIIGVIESVVRDYLTKDNLAYYLLQESARYSPGKMGHHSGEWDQDSNNSICDELQKYITNSRYCGVRLTAQLMASSLECHEVDETTVRPRRRTTTTAAATTTTTTTPTTTTTTPTTTTTTPTTRTTTPTTTTTTQTTTTTTPTTTTTTPTTTTPTTTSRAQSTTTTTVQPPATCGISGVATSLVSARSAGLFLARRVVGGVNAGSCAVYPWMVSLNVDGGQICGGVILDATHILTAAHCVVNKNSIQATVGEYDSTATEGTEQVFNINTATGVAIHPDFDYIDRTNDVSVLTLDMPINLDQICAKPICLDPTYKVTSGQKCQIAGWGMTDENSFTPSTILQTASITTYQGPDCLAAFPNSGSNYLSDPTKQLCAGEQAGGVDACGGDAGGPLFCLDQTTNRWIAAGIVSYGEGCARPEYPGVYADTSVYYDWIQQQL